MEHRKRYNDINHDLRLYCYYDMLKGTELLESVLKRETELTCYLTGKESSNTKIYTYIGLDDYNEVDLSWIANYTDITLDSIKNLLYENFHNIPELLSNYTDKSIEELSEKELRGIMIEAMEKSYSYTTIACQYYKHFTPRYTLLKITGYYQRDYAEVIVPEEVYYSGLEDYLKDVIFATPITCGFYVDDTFYDLSEGLDSVFNWNKEKILNYANKELPDLENRRLILEWLDDYLLYPEYSD